MYNIVVCCVSALSSSVLVSKMKDAAKELGLKTIIRTVGEAGLDLAWPDADIVLLAPQVRHLKGSLEEKVKGSIPVVAINDIDFGQMDGMKVLQSVVEIVGQK